MWRQIITLVVVVTLEVHARSLRSPPGAPEQLPSEVYELLAQCSDFCRNASRHCLSPPRRCGACLPDYAERDGLCFHRYNPADEVDTWQQALRLANEGLESRGDSRAPLDESRDDEQQLLLEENNDSPETEDDTETDEEVQEQEAETSEDEYAAQQRQEEEDELVGEKETRSDTTLDDTNKIVEKTAAVKPSESKSEQQKHDDGEIQVHEMPVPAAMVQMAAKQPESYNPLSEFYTLAIVIGCAVVSIFVLVGAGLCYYRYHQNAKAATAVDYPAFAPPGGAPVQGVPREQRAGSGDRKLAQSAQMYHYQHQKQQMIAAERASDELNKDEESEEEENEEGDYTVYECPGLAPTGEMEVKNPLFADEGTTVTASADSPKKD